MMKIAPVVAAAWTAAARQLKGTGGIMYGAQLPGR
jgi:hypothetical protein